MTRQRSDPVGVYSRRHFGKLALASLPVAGALGGPALFARQARPNSVWGGVPFGIFTPYRFGPEASDLEAPSKPSSTSESVRQS